MGLRGPKPKPTVLKLIAGNPGKRPIDLSAEASPDAKLPTMPNFLNAEAKKEWKRLGPYLVKLGLVSQLDRAALALYCQAWGQLVMIEDSLSADIVRAVADGGDITDAMSFTTEKGYQGQSVKVQLVNSLREQVNKYLASFGLSPSARSRVKASGAADAGGVGRTQGWGKFNGGG